MFFYNSNLGVRRAIIFFASYFFKNFAFKMAASNMVAFDLSHYTDFEQVKIVNGHFTDFEQGKISMVILLTLNMSKFLVVILLNLNNNYKFINFLVIFFLYYIKKKSKTFL